MFIQFFKNEMMQRGKQQKQSQPPNSFQIYKQFLKNIQVTFQLCCQCNAENRSFFSFGTCLSMFRMTHTHLLDCSEWQQITENPDPESRDQKQPRQGLGAQTLDPGAESALVIWQILDKPQLPSFFIPKKKCFISISVFK